MFGLILINLNMKYQSTLSRFNGIYFQLNTEKKLISTIEDIFGE